MAALNWQSRKTTLNSLTLAGADDVNRDTMVSQLDHYGGAMYDAARAYFGPSAVDASKAASEAQFAAATTAWGAAAQPVHVAGVRFTVFIDGGPPIVFAPDGSAGQELIERLADAETALAKPTHPKTRLKEECNNHLRAVTQAYGARPTAPIYTPPYTTPTPILYGMPGSKPPRNYDLYTYERDVLGPLIAEADLLISELST